MGWNVQRMLVVCLAEVLAMNFASKPKQKSKPINSDRLIAAEPKEDEHENGNHQTKIELDLSVFTGRNRNAATI